jgi:hypothetical protein
MTNATHLATMRRTLRAERRRGVAGHWAYDLPRHAHLHHVYQQERLRVLATYLACRAARDARVSTLDAGMLTLLAFVCLALPH